MATNFDSTDAHSQSKDYQGTKKSIHNIITFILQGPRNYSEARRIIILFHQHHLVNTMRITLLDFGKVKTGTD